MDTASVILKLVLNHVFIAGAFTSVELRDTSIKFRNNCVSNSRVVCEYSAVRVSVCLTRVSHSSGLVVYGMCPYIIQTGQEIHKQWTSNSSFQKYYHINFTVPEQICGELKRKGLLCSECYDGYGPAVYAFANECIKCHGSVFSRWALYLFVVLFPITVFYIIVITFNIQATSPPFTAYVLFCQTFAALDRIYFPGSIKFTVHDSGHVLLLLARTLSGIWNLDFGRYILPPFCVSDAINTYHALFLDYIPGFYPMLLIFFTCVLIELHSSNFKLIVLLWKPFHKCFVRVRRSWDPKASMINAFATFLLLSFSKILFVLCFSLQYEIIVNIKDDGYRPYALFYNPSIDVHSYENLPFIAVSFTLSTIFVLLPTIFLCCYQFTRKIPFCWRCGMQHKISIFMDAFQGHYKDGTNGTYDLRFLAGLYLILRIVIVYFARKHKLLARNASPGQMHYYFIVTVIVAFVRPYKRFIHNLTETLLLLMIVLIIWNVSAFQRISYSQEDRMMIAVLQLIPHSFFVMLITFKIIKLLIHKLKLQCNGRLIVDKLTKSNHIWSRLFSNDEATSSLTADLHTQTYGAIK